MAESHPSDGASKASKASKASTIATVPSRQVEGDSPLSLEGPGLKDGESALELPSPDEIAERTSKSNRAVRLLCLMGLVGFALFAFVDPYMVPTDSDEPFLELRAVVLICFGAIFLLARTAWGEQRSLLLGYGVLSVAGVGITLLTGMTGGADQVYWAMLMLAFFAGALVLPSSPGPAGRCFYGVAAFYTGWLPLQGLTGSLSAWVASVAGVWVSAWISTMAVGFLHRSSEREWQTRRRLQRANKSLLAEIEERRAAEEATRRAEEELKEARALAREMGSYRLVRLIGKGGMGEVWLAQHGLLARPAAIKCVRVSGSKGGANETDLKRFEQEAQATAGLTSPHTVEVYDYGRADDGSFYYVMELLRGVDLHTLVKEHGAQSPARVVHLLRQVCHSLRDAHTEGVLHRDIKPANLMVGSRGQESDYLKVLDFGLVKLSNYKSGSDGLTAKDLVSGTPAYMAPEMAKGLELDGRADLYALGCVGYWLLAGRPVFPHANSMQLLISHATEAPRPIGELVTAVMPVALGDLVMTCLAKAREDRPASADLVMKSLDAIALEHPWTEEDASSWWTAHRPNAEDSVQVPSELEVTAFLRPDSSTRLTLGD